jgi:hypothetical protein
MAARFIAAGQRRRFEIPASVLPCYAQQETLRQCREWQSRRGKVVAADQDQCLKLLTIPIFTKFKKYMSATALALVPAG